MSPRRRALVALGVLSLSARASGAIARATRVAYLASALTSPEQAGRGDAYFETVRTVLGNHGFVTGQNLEMRFFSRSTAVEGGYSGPWREAIIRESLAWQPDLLVVSTAAFARLAKALNKKVPMVFALVQDPVSEGLVANIRQPGGNMTGAAIDYDQLAVKRLELAREVLPQGRRILMVHDTRGDGLPAAARHHFIQVASRLQFAITELDIAGVSGGLCRAAPLVRSVRADAILPMGNIFTEFTRNASGTWVDGYGGCLYAVQSESGVPVVDDSVDTVGEGVAIALGERNEDSFGRAATIAVQVLKGAKPAEVPVDLQMRVQLAVNRASAERLGLKIPGSVLLRAERIV